jgi:hypothetical protein
MAKSKSKQKAFLRAVAEAARNDRPMPEHPLPETQREIEQAGSVAAWIKQSPARLRQFNHFMVAVLGKNKRGKIKIPRKKRRGKWPRELRSKVKGYRRPQNQSRSFRPPPLSAGMPGNEETDPGPHKR